MKPININARNSIQITAALLGVNGRANSHTITQAGEIREIAETATDYLARLGLSKSQMLGAKVTFTSGGNIPAAYEWPRITTRVELERRKSGWFLTSIVALKIRGNAPKAAYLLTCEQDRLAVAQTGYTYLTAKSRITPHWSQA